MPFITLENRQKMDLYMSTGQNPSEIAPGDYCYVYYKNMVDVWKKERRWITAHRIYKNMTMQLRNGEFSDDQTIAYILAWQVFFQLHVMEYEKEKRIENGDI